MLRYLTIPSYAVVGPPLGAVVFWAITLLPAAISGTIDHGFDERAWRGGLKLLGMYASFSYLLGILPALGAGVLHAVVWNRRSPRVRVAAAAATGLLLSALLLLLGAGAGEADAIFMAVGGGLSALLIAVCFEGLRRGERARSAFRNEA